VQRAPGVGLLGANIALSANDLAFIGSGTEQLTIKTERIENELVLTITG
jgi:hypothetical protein